MKVGKIFTLFLVSMLFLSISIGTVMASSDEEDKELVIKDDSGNVKEDSTGNAGKIPEIGNLSTPSTAEDITGDLGILSGLGDFIIKYAVQITIFVMVLAAVILNLRGSWARGNNNLDDAVTAQKNQKGLLEDGIYVMAVLLFIFCVFAPFVKSFIQQ